VFRRAICGEQTRGYWQVFANLAYRVSGPVADVAAPGLVKRLEIERVGGHVVPAYADQFSHQSATVTPFQVHHESETLRPALRRQEDEFGCTGYGPGLGKLYEGA
jgi:hypothetical protein